MKIAVDIMGGDHAPEELIKGAVAAAEHNPSLELILVGSEEAFQKFLPVLPPRIERLYSHSVMAMDEPVDHLRKKKDSSIYLATSLVREGKADAIVSAGSTGAQMAAAVLLIGRIKGVRRPAIVIPYPTLEGDKVMLDGGANPDATVENLVDFAILGNAYAKHLLKIENPSVKLLSNGTESHKGTAVIVEAHQRLAATKCLSFDGNIEGRDMMKGGYDVVVCDGFSGNVALKLTEGVASALFKLVKDEITATLPRKIGAALIKPGLMNLRKRLDYSNQGGAPLLGVNGISIICHGSSKAIAIEHAIVTAANCVERDFIHHLADAVSEYTAEQSKEVVK